VGGGGGGDGRRRREDGQVTRISGDMRERKRWKIMRRW